MASLPPSDRRPVRKRRERRELCAEGRGQRRQPARQDAGRAARPARRQVARQVREVPRRSRLFRGARRGRARPDRGRAGGAQPRLLRQISEHCVRRGLSEQAPPSRLPVHLRLRRQSRRDPRARHVGARARRSRKAMLDGKLWLPEVGKSTHYHAYWVRPSWVGEMKKTVQVRRAHLLSAAQLGRRQRRAELGHAGADRGALGEARREAKSEAEIEGCAKASADRSAAHPESRMPHISISSATSKFGAECVSAPDET